MYHMYDMALIIIARSGDMRRAASAAMSSSAGWGGSGGEGASTSSRVMGEVNENF